MKALKVLVLTAALLTSPFSFGATKLAYNPNDQEAANHDKKPVDCLARLGSANHFYDIGSDTTPDLKTAARNSGSSTSGVR